MPVIYTDGSECEVSGSEGKYLFEWSGHPDLSLGDRIDVSAPIRQVDADPDSFASRKGVIGVVNGIKGRFRVTSRGPVWWVIASEWRRSFMSFSDRTLSPRAARTVDALCFNQGRRLSSRDKTNLQRTGTIHIISASGLHVLILVFGLQIALGLLPISRWGQLLIMCCLLAVYAGAAGLEPAILRSIVMAAVLATAYLFRREADLLCSLGLSASLFALWRPGDVFDLSFQLSFVAVAGLALFGPQAFTQHGTPWRRLRSQIAAIVQASLAATLATAPIVMYHFGILSIVSVVANVLIAAVMAPILVGAMLSWAASLFASTLATGMMIAGVEPLTGWLLWVVDSLGPQPWSAVSVPAFSPYWIALYYLGALLIWRRRARAV